jgi:hypothetical protein
MTTTITIITTEITNWIAPGEKKITLFIGLFSC